MSMASSHVVIRERSKLQACMTCPLCRKLFREATTISECLHTFCRKCIYKKIVDEEFDCCPVCNTHLGVSPLEKLRADNSWEDIRAKLFPADRKKVNAPTDHNVQTTTTKSLPSERKEVNVPAEDIPEKPFPSERKIVNAPAEENVQDIPVKPLPEGKKSKLPAVSSGPLPAKRKERYLSSLVINTPRVSGRPDVNGRRRYPTRRSFPLRQSLSIRDPDEQKEDHEEKLKAPETLKRDALCTRQHSGEGSSKQHILNKGVEHNTQLVNGKADLALNRVMQAANNTNSDNLIVQLPIAKLALSDTVNNEAHGTKAVAEQPEVYGNESNPAASAPVTVKKPQRGRKKKPAVPDQGLNVPVQSVIDANNKFDRRTFSPIWFSLIAASHQECYPPLPQIPSCYLRVKDGNLPASFIKKYLVKKLDLASEEEVEISLWGRPIIPTLQLHHLIDLWLRATPPSQGIQATVGASAKECVMVLTYHRKLQLR